MEIKVHEEIVAKKEKEHQHEKDVKQEKLDKIHHTEVLKEKEVQLTKDS